MFCRRALGFVESRTCSKCERVIDKMICLYSSKTTYFERLQESFGRLPVGGFILYF